VKAAAGRGRLRRSDCSGPGLQRRGRGRGFEYLRENGKRVTDEHTLERIRDLAIPPAWREVWICSDPLGHLQATGIDDAGRKQYLYHERWRERRDRAKFDRMVSFAGALPRLRRRVAEDLDGSDGSHGSDGSEPTRERVLACSVRLLDVGLFRIGGEEYAEHGGGLGLTTIHKRHVSIESKSAVFDYPAKGGIRRVQSVDDPVCVALIRTLRRRRGGGEQLLAYRDGRTWAPVRADDVNEYLKERLGEEFSAKDFRTWNATVLGAAVLAATDKVGSSKTARQRAVKRAVNEVAEVLGNTPAVARRSYIDPRIVDRYLSGWTIGPALANAAELDALSDRSRRRLELAVVDLLTGDHDSSAVTRIAA
jgi:DNA topoisomerase I